ncbi:bifunctional Mitochondrial carrier domain superfamily/Mitochondrial substrate-solute carrier [Babesia duncani]|uniref:Bifunctional Mitochondrial carrier domain superfamily/Mitochondrial substrate-solute carrier n=1 Tax=Babesia duncani TaxID=323732 RepID=A0AAD9PJF8_9APIC|nr:bifunctional Mitochondrial carrier domain superfamily/Mitochondrial substrate-solute carrier [Babesia duncani]
MEPEDDDAFMDFDEWKGDLKFWQHAVCGSIAGVMEHISIFPLDTLKTRLQSGWCECSNIKECLPPPNNLSSPSQPNKLQWNRNLFRGSNAIAAGCVPAHILYFTVYEFIKKTGNVATAGAMATVCHDIVLTPADVVKQRLQLGMYNGSIHCLSSLIRQEGIASLFRSLSTTLFMNIPYQVVLVSVNEFLKKLGRSKNRKTNAATYFLYAGVGGAIAGALTNPLDVIKTRLQVQHCMVSGKQKIQSPKYKNPFKATRMIYMQEGLGAFFKGISTRMAICIPGAAISWGTYEMLKSILFKPNTNN